MCSQFINTLTIAKRGWNPDHEDGPATQPYGIGGDPDFVGGSDLLMYDIPRASFGEYTITGQLLFQVIAPRHANELFQFETPEVEQFKVMFDKADRKPETLATTIRKSVAN